MILGLALFLILIIFGVLYSFLNFNKASQPKTATLGIGSYQIVAEIADQSRAWVKGLSGRENLAPDRGMLFIFPNREIRNFWMNGMKFSLDIIWLNGNQVVGIEENAPYPAAGGEPLAISSQEPVDQILELNAGAARKFGIEVGDYLDIFIAK